MDHSKVICFRDATSLPSVGRVIEMLPDQRVKVQYFCRPIDKQLRDYKPSIYEYWATPNTAILAENEEFVEIDCLEYQMPIGNPDLSMIKASDVDMHNVIIYARRFFIPEYCKLENRIVKKERIPGVKKFDYGCLIPLCAHSRVAMIREFKAGKDTDVNGDLSQLVFKCIFEPAISTGSSKRPVLESKGRLKRDVLGLREWKHFYAVFASSNNPDPNDYAKLIVDDALCFDLKKEIKYLQFREGTSTTHLGEAVSELFKYIRMENCIPEFAVYLIEHILPRSYQLYLSRYFKTNKRQSLSESEDDEEEEDAEDDVDENGNVRGLIAADDEKDELSSTDVKLDNARKKIGEESSSEEGDEPEQPDEEEDEDEEELDDDDDASFVPKDEDLDDDEEYEKNIDKKHKDSEDEEETGSDDETESDASESSSVESVKVESKTETDPE